MRYLRYVALAALMAAFTAALAPASSPVHADTGVDVLDETKVYAGYTLFTPVLGDASAPAAAPPSDNAPPTAGGVVYLINMHGQPVHTWTFERRPGPYAQLLPNGNLLYASDAEKDVVLPPGGGGELIEVDWDGNVVWRYKNDYLHHDFDMIPDGNVAALIYEKMPADLTAQVQGGLPGTELEDGTTWSDSIIEIDREGNVVWKWDAWLHIDPQEVVIHPDLNRQEWTHANSMRYLDTNPITGGPGYLVSFRQNNVIVIVDRASEEVVWLWGADTLSHQHDARLLDNGNVLVFDNGEDPKDDPTQHVMPRSRVLEVTPQGDRGGEIVWDYTVVGFDGFPFYSPIISGAQRLPNGNTLVTEGTTGRVFELTSEKEIVWEYRSPYGLTVNRTLVPWIFKALRYTADDVDFPEPLPDPLELLDEEDTAAGGGEVVGAAAATPAGSGGDLDWWVLAVVGVAAAALAFGGGFGLARNMRR